MSKLSYENIVNEVAKIKRLADIAADDANCGYYTNLHENLREIQRQVDYLLDKDWEVV